MAMVVQSGIGISRVLFLLATGHIGGSILLKDRKLSDLIGYIFFEKPKDQPKGETNEALAAEVRHLIDVVRNLSLTPSAPIIWNGGSEQSNLSSLVVPAAAIGVVGYGYMWLKGLSFSSLMYVTRRSMENAVADLTKKLQHASDVIDDAKKHLTERIQKLVDKMQKQIKITRQIEDDTTGSGFL